MRVTVLGVNDRNVKTLKEGIRKFDYSNLFFIFIPSRILKTHFKNYLVISIHFSITIPDVIILCKFVRRWQSRRCCFVICNLLNIQPWQRKAARLEVSLDQPLACTTKSYSKYKSDYCFCTTILQLAPAVTDKSQTAVRTIHQMANTRRIFL